MDHLMKKILSCRRTITSLFAISCLTGLGIAKGMDVSMAIAGICAALSGANAFENKNKPTEEGK